MCESNIGYAEIEVLSEGEGSFCSLAHEAPVTAIPVNRSPSIGLLLSELARAEKTLIIVFHD
jgi:hypothetical protein